MKLGMWFKIIIAVTLTFSLAENVILTTQNNQISSDLCYSIKTNRILMEGFINLSDNYNIEIKTDNFYEALEIIEERSWMECK